MAGEMSLAAKSGMATALVDFAASDREYLINIGARMARTASAREFRVRCGAGTGGAPFMVSEPA